MGCAGSNPLPAAGETMAAAANGRATVIDGPSEPMADVADKSYSIVERVIDNVNVDNMVKKIQDVTGSMENLMGETQEKISSFFGNVEENVEDVENTIKDKVNDSTLPEESKIHHVILLTEEETRIIPIDLVESAIKNSLFDEEQINKDHSEINIKDVGIDEDAKEQEVTVEVKEEIKEDENEIEIEKKEENEIENEEKEEVKEEKEENEENEEEKEKEEEEKEEEEKLEEEKEKEEK